MRFLENGPDIPSELLEARDEGAVVFFCGSGVSRAKANLPDFFGLARDVLQELRVPENAEASVVFREAEEIGSRVKVSGLLSADLIFGLLERRYAVTDIQAAVARCIGRRIVNNLDAHSVLLRLARTPAGRRQLVTTNFDRLFSECDAAITSYVSPHLPQLTDFDALDGIVYLHGRLNLEYTEAESNGFVLSSADFGNAYLSEGWATDFFRKLARKFTIVFIGYSGDDPPIRYLLEGSNRDKLQSGTLFAFQCNESEESLAKWRYKGVTPIGFESFPELWSTLELWAERADDPAMWQEKIVALASHSPKLLKPHERGQIVQLVSSFQGAKQFLSKKPNSEWLCVFDPRIRFNPHMDLIDDSVGVLANSPFDNFGLDSDPPQQHTEKRARYGDSEIPPSLVNVLEPNRADQRSITESVQVATGLMTSERVIPLSNRLQCLAEWIAQSVHEPSSLWWGSRQHNLHPDIKGRIGWRIDRSTEAIEPAVARRWKNLLECWKSNDAERGIGWYDFDQHIRSQGWSHSTLRIFGQVMKPTIAVERPIFSSFSMSPPVDYDGIAVDDICRIEIQIPQIQPGFEVPDEWGCAAAQQLAQSIVQIELACHEFSCLHELDLCPIHFDPNPEIDSNRRIDGLSGVVNFYVSLYLRILQSDPERARTIFLSWPTDSRIFDRIRIWCTSKESVVLASEIPSILGALDRSVIWDSYVRRDLLVSLQERWPGLATSDRARLELLVLDGPPQWDEEESTHFDARKNHNVAVDLSWLQLHGCELSLHAQTELSRIKAGLPDWKDEYSRRAADSRETRGGWVRTDTDSEELKHLPVSDVIETARRLSGRGTDTFLVERDPFTGYCRSFPDKALGALKHASNSGECTVNEWNKFLDAKLRADDTTDFRIQIASSLHDLCVDCLAKISYYATWWFKDSFGELVKDAAVLAEQLLDKFVATVKSHPQHCGSGIVAGREDRDWMMEAINSSVGRTVQTILDSYFSKDALSKAGHLQRLSDVLGLEATMRQLALTILSQYVIWFNRQDKAWTEANLLSAFYTSEKLDRQAAWSGFLWNPKVDNELFSRMKPGLLDLAAKRGDFKRGHLQSIAGLVLVGWLPEKGGDKGQQITNEELHDALLSGGPEFRTQILWQLQRDLASSTDVRESVMPSVVTLLKDVWPKELEVRSPDISASILDLLLVDEVAFGQLVTAALPLLVPLTQEQRFHFHFQEQEIKPAINAHPEKFLKMLCKILPEEPELWPYGFGNTLQLILSAEPDLKNDHRFESLQQRWNRRW